MDERLVPLSKTVAYVLRHNPGAGGVTLDGAGWVAIDELLAGLQASGYDIGPDELDTIVHGSDKARYEIKQGRIRAAQGHSISVDLGLDRRTPPDHLFHGTVERFLASILESGLRPGERTHVHLSIDRETASTVGARRGAPVILVVDAGRMDRDGHRFWRAENGVWLVDSVPAQYLTIAGRPRAELDDG